MVIIRPVHPDDIDSLMELAAQTSFGLTTLPHDRPLLKRRIKDSQRGFSRMAEKPGGETYLFAGEMKNRSTRGVFKVNFPGGATKVEVIGESRQLPIDDGEFMDIFRPYQVHLYRVRAAPAQP